MNDESSDFAAVATKAECIIDDEEGITSLTLWWGARGSYLMLSSESDSTKVHCEFVNQANGFYPTTLEYTARRPTVVFSLRGDEFFDRVKRTQRVSIECSNAQMFDDVVQVLSALFS